VDIASVEPHVAEVVRGVLVPELVRTLKPFGRLAEVAFDLERVPAECVDRCRVVERRGALQLFQREAQVRFSAVTLTTPHQPSEIVHSDEIFYKSSRKMFNVSGALF